MQTLVQIIFVLNAALIIGAALMVVSVKNVIHAALWLITSFFGVGALYLLLEAEFLAVVQVLIYVGAISVLILFAIMLTQQLMREADRPLYRYWWVALLVSATLFAAIITPTVANQEWNVVPPIPAVAPGEPSGIAGAVELGTAFVREYLLQFQMAGILLLVALIGAIVIAYEERERRRRVLTLAEEVELRKRQQQRADPKPPVPAPAPAPALQSNSDE
jgi:NADH-quinone oxidoreductase subunit J